jgi:adenine-specific DNA-methyltransferase
MTNLADVTLKGSRAEACLWRTDALAFLDAIPERSVDLVVTSPPYCVGKEYDRFSKVEDFKAEVQRVAETLVSRVKDTGSVCWQVGNHVSAGEIFPLEYAIYEIFSNIPEVKLRNRIIWTFGHGAHAKKRFSGRHEVILWFTKSNDYYFDLDKVREPQKYPGKRHYKGEKRGQFSGNPLGKNPGDVWDIPNVKAQHVEKTQHPCQFPVALARRLCLALCPKGGMVIDPYMGSGSAGVAAMLEGRDFSGSDLETRYFDIAVDRLTRAISGTVPVRPDIPVLAPDPTQAVSKRPSHFLHREVIAHGADH